MWRKGAKRGGKRGAAKRAPRRVPRAVKSKKYNVPERASLTETIPWGGTGRCFTGINYKLNNVSLSQTRRARLVAQGYQYFRITGITMRFKPLQDTFTQQPTTGGPQASIPYLYTMIDRSGRLGNEGFSDYVLRQLGAKPRRLDDKTLIFTFKPNVLTETYDNTAGAATNVQYKVSPWLPCRDDATLSVWNPSTIDHLGMVFLADQDNGNQAINFSVEYELQFEFKKPTVPVLSGDVPPVYGPDDVVPDPNDLSGNAVVNV